MFIEDDLLNYLAQMQTIENRMHEVYQNLHDQLSHPEYKRIFGRLAQEEKTHGMVIQGLKRLIMG